MAKRYYKVRAVNPGPAPRATNPAGKARRPKKTGNYVVRYVPGPEESEIGVRFTGAYAGGDEVVLLLEPEEAKDAWSRISGDFDVERLLRINGYDEYGNYVRGRRNNPKGKQRKNVAKGSITIEEQGVLEDLAHEARESEDDWGIQQGVRDYLDEAYAKQASDTPAEFLEGLQRDVWWHYGHSGEGSEAEGADPGLSRESAQRAERMIGRARKRLPQRPRAAARPLPRPRRVIEQVELVYDDDVEFSGTLEEFVEKYQHDFAEARTNEDEIRERLERGHVVPFVDGTSIRASRWSERKANAPEPRIVYIVQRSNERSLEGDEYDDLDEAMREVKKKEARGFRMTVKEFDTKTNRAKAIYRGSRPKRAKPATNPRFRYAAVPVDDGGTETAHVVRGRRRADMVRDVARSVPGDAMVDLQRTRTFATKHEATEYARATSPRVRTLGRRVTDGGR